MVIAAGPRGREAGEVGVVLNAVAAQAPAAQGPRAPGAGQRPGRPCRPVGPHRDRLEAVVPAAVAQVHGPVEGQGRRRPCALAPWLLREVHAPPLEREARQPASPALVEGQQGGAARLADRSPVLIAPPRRLHEPVGGVEAAQRRPPPRSSPSRLRLTVPPVRLMVPRPASVRPP